MVLTKQQSAVARGFRTASLKSSSKECKQCLTTVLDSSQGALVYQNDIKQLSRILRKLGILLDDLGDHDDSISASAEGLGVQQVQELQQSIERYGRFVDTCTVTGKLGLLFQCQQLCTEFTDIVVDIVQSLEALNLEPLQCQSENIEDTQLLVQQLKRQPLLFPVDSLSKLAELRKKADELRLSGIRSISQPSPAQQQQARGLLQTPPREQKPSPGQEYEQNVRDVLDESTPVQLQSDEAFLATALNNAKGEQRHVEAHFLALLHEATTAAMPPDLDRLQGPLKLKQDEGSSTQEPEPVAYDFINLPQLEGRADDTNEGQRRATDSDEPLKMSPRKAAEVNQSCLDVQVEAITLISTLLGASEPAPNLPQLGDEDQQALAQELLSMGLLTHVLRILSYPSPPLALACITIVDRLLVLQPPLLSGLLGTTYVRQLMAFVKPVLREDDAREKSPTRERSPARAWSPRGREDDGKLQQWKPDPPRLPQMEGEVDQEEALLLVQERALVSLRGLVQQSQAVIHQLKDMKALPQLTAMLVPFRIKDGKPLVDPQVVSDITKKAHKADSSSPHLLGEAKHSEGQGDGGKRSGKERSKEHRRERGRDKDSKGRRVRSRKAAAQGRKEEVRGRVLVLLAEVLELVCREMQEPVRQAGGVPVCCVGMKYPSIAVKVACAKSLCSLLQDAKCKMQALQTGAISILVSEWKAVPPGSELRQEVETTLKFLVSPEFASTDNRSLISDTSTVITAVTDTLSSWSASGSTVGLVDALAVEEVVAVMEVRSW